MKNDQRVSRIVEIEDRLARSLKRD